MIGLAVASENKVRALKHLASEVDMRSTHARVDHGHDDVLARGVRPDNLGSLIRLKGPLCVTRLIGVRQRCPAANDEGSSERRTP
jgi:hypothetical protein